MLDSLLNIVYFAVALAICFFILPYVLQVAFYLVLFAVIVSFFGWLFGVPTAEFQSDSFKFKFEF